MQDSGKVKNPTIQELIRQYYNTREPAQVAGEQIEASPQVLNEEAATQQETPAAAPIEDSYEEMPQLSSEGDAAEVPQEEASPETLEAQETPQLSEAQEEAVEASEAEAARIPAGEEDLDLAEEIPSADQEVFGASSLPYNLSDKELLNSMKKLMGHFNFDTETREIKAKTYNYGPAQLYVEQALMQAADAKGNPGVLDKDEVDILKDALKGLEDVLKGTNPKQATGAALVLMQDVADRVSALPTGDENARVRVLTNLQLAANDIQVTAQAVEVMDELLVTDYLTPEGQALINTQRDNLAAMRAAYDRIDVSLKEVKENLDRVKDSIPKDQKDARKEVDSLKKTVDLLRRISNGKIDDQFKDADKRLENIQKKLERLGESEMELETVNYDLEALQPRIDANEQRLSDALAQAGVPVPDDIQEEARDLVKSLDKLMKRRNQLSEKRDDSIEDIIKLQGKKLADERMDMLKAYNNFLKDKQVRAILSSPA